MGFCPAVFIDNIFRLFRTPTLKPHNFVNKDPFLTNLALLKSSRTGLFNGAKFVKNGPLLIKLWGSKVD